MKKLIIMLALLMPAISNAAFEGSAVPIGVYHIACDGNPRIVVDFDGTVTSVWYPANGTYAKEFLSTALAAKASSSQLYYYGNGSTTPTGYCVSRGAGSEIYLFGIE